MPSYPISFPYINHPQYLPNALTFTTGLRGVASSSSAYIPAFASPGFALGGTGSIATSGTNQFTGDFQFSSKCSKISEGNRYFLSTDIQATQLVFVCLKLNCIVISIVKKDIEDGHQSLIFIIVSHLN